MVGDGGGTGRGHGHDREAEGGSGRVKGLSANEPGAIVPLGLAATAWGGTGWGWGWSAWRPRPGERGHGHGENARAGARARSTWQPVLGPSTRCLATAETAQRTASLLGIHLDSLRQAEDHQAQHDAATPALKLLELHPPPVSPRHNSQLVARQDATWQ